MTKYQECTGKTETLALDNALRTLGLERDDVSVEILERAKSGFLGIGSSPAKIRVSYEVPDEPEEEVIPKETPAAPEKVVYEAPKAEPVKVEAPKTQVPKKISQEKTSKPEGPKPVLEPEPTHPVDDEVSGAIVTFLSGLLSHMKVEADVEVSISDRGSYEVLLVGKDLGGLIGRRGETLDAIQQLTSYSVNRGQSKRVRIHVDAEGYRAKREESLQRLAVKVAGKVVKYRKNMTLEPMNAYERHVIHTALQDYKGVTTYSTGVEPNRRTVVAYAPHQK